MSIYFNKYEAQANKMENLMAANGLLHTFKTNIYPITMVIQPNAAPDEQMAMFETDESGISSPDARLVLQFPVGEVVVRAYGRRLIISDALLNKIKNQAKKMRDLWLQADFAARMEQAGNSTSHYVDDDAEDETDADDFEEFFEDDDSQE